MLDFLYFDCWLLFDIYVAKVPTDAVANFKSLKKTAVQTNFCSKNQILIDYNKFYDVDNKFFFDGCFI